MSAKKNFGIIWNKLTQFVKDENEINDVDLMMKLNFSPPSWKVWKSQFRDKSECTKIIFTNPDGIKSEHKITYNNKMKTWSWENLQ